MADIPDLRGFFKTIVAIAGIVAALAAGVAGWSALGWWWPVSQAIHRADIAELAPPILAALRDIRNRLKAQRIKLMERRAAVTEQQARDDLQALLDQVEMEIEENGAMILGLERRR